MLLNHLPNILSFPDDALHCFSEASNPAFLVAAIGTVVTVAEILKNNGLATEKSKASSYSYLYDYPLNLEALVFVPHVCFTFFFYRSILSRDPDINHRHQRRVQGPACP